MTDGPRPGATETFARTRTECSERPLPEPSSPAVQQRSLSRRGRTALAIAAVALASVLMAASVGCGTKAPTAVDTQLASPSATASAEASPSAPAKPEVAPTPTKNPREYSASMENYTNMSVEEFEALPRNERLAYSQFVNETLVFATDYEAHYDQYSRYPQYGLTNYVTSPDNTGQEIVDNNMYQLQLAYLQFTQPNGILGGSETGDTTNTYNLSDGRKALSSVYYNVGEFSSENMTTKVYGETVAQQETLTGATVLSGINTVKNTSDLMTGTIQGESVEYKDIQFEYEKGVMHYDRYVLTNYTDYDGSIKSIWLLETQEASTAQRDSTSAIK